MANATKRAGLSRILTPNKRKYDRRKGKNIQQE